MAQKSTGNGEKVSSKGIPVEVVASAGVNPNDYIHILSTEVIKIKELLFVLLATQSSPFLREAAVERIVTEGLGADFLPWFKSGMKQPTGPEPSEKPYMDQTVKYKCGCTRSLKDGPIPKICPEHGQWETRSLD